MKKRSLFFILLLFLVLGIVEVPSVFAVIDCTGNPTTISAQGTVFVLQDDYLLMDGGSCIIVKADNVIIDGNGHTITGNPVEIDGEIGFDSSNGVVVLASSNVEVKNIRSRFLGAGIFLNNTKNSRVYNNRLNGGHTGIRLDGNSTNNIIEFNDVTNNNATQGQSGSYGITVRTGSDSNTIRNNDASFADDTGIWVRARHSLIENNIINGEEGDIVGRDNGIIISNSNNTLINNTVKRYQHGVAISSSNIVLIGNTFEENNYGIGFLSSSNGHLIENNKLNNNLYTGIYSLHKLSESKFSNNFLNGNPSALILRGSSNNLFEGGEILNSLRDAIRLEVNATNTTFSNILIEGTNEDFNDLVFAGSGAYPVSLNSPTLTIEGIVLENMNIGKYKFEKNGGTFNIKNQQGEIIFLDKVNGSGNSLSNDVKVAFNRAEIRSDLNPGLNKESLIILKGLPQNPASPVILRNTLPCGTEICTPLTPLNQQDVTFKVTRGGVYSISGLEEETCDLTSAAWKNLQGATINSAFEGEIVNLVTEGLSCLGKTINLRIYEDDLNVLFISTDELVYHTTITFSQDGMASANWEVLGGIETFGNLEYYFVASLVEDESESVTSNILDVANSEYCGNGIKEAAEQCDDGNSINGDGCEVDCRLTPISECGNGITEGSELCDDGNLINGDGCSSICQTEEIIPVEICGNGILEGTEDCDGTAFSLGSNLCSAYNSIFTGGNLLCNNCNIDVRNCIQEQGAVCGNGIIEGLEQCDNGTLNGQACSTSYGKTNYCCTLDCTVFAAVAPRCGDGIIDNFFGEQCDDGNALNADGCDFECRLEEGAVCGNGIKEAAEQCDDGPLNGQPCSVSYGVTKTCCTHICSSWTVSGPRCGDGRVDIYYGETCDDGNALSGDGCSSQCKLE